MRLVISPEESARLDAAASDPVDLLMERAGYGVAAAAARMGAGYGRRVAVLAGPGNNGGDGYVAARYLRGRGAAVTVHALAPPRPGGAAARAAAAAGAGGVRVIPLRAGPSLPSADLIVDALFGAGFHGTLPPAAAAWVDHPAPVLAVDVPSGLNAADGLVAGPAFIADTTVTFHALKVGHVVGEGPDRCGAVEVVDIGLEGGRPELRLTEAADAPRPLRQRRAHKWSAGSVMVAGGSPGLTGAAWLAARSALSAGAGAATVACPGGLQGTYAALSAGVMNVGIGTAERFRPGDAAELVEAAGRYDVLVLGPGLGPDQDELVAAVLEGREAPLLVDADGLNAMSGPERVAQRRPPTVLTPHAGEFRRLAGTDADHVSAARLASATGATVLLKGNPTIVAGTTTWVVDSGGPELATIGTGDVLAGFVAALWARGLDGDTAARSGAYWHGRAAKELSRSTTVTAELLADFIGGFAG